MRKVTLGSIEDHIGPILKSDRCHENIVIALVAKDRAYSIVLFDDDCNELISRINCDDLAMAERRYERFVRDTVCKFY